MTYETPWYLIDTDDFETAGDVKDMIRNIIDEAQALCQGCPKRGKCSETVDIPEDHPGCLCREEYRALAEVMNALRPYAAALTTGNVA
jgi:hypothetical protein